MMPFAMHSSDYIPSAFERYTALESERLYKVSVTRVERWRYIDDRPFLEIADLPRGTYSLKEQEHIGRADA